MTAPAPNVDLLRRTLAYIEEHPQEWNQRAWRCGTTACFAGHAVILDGGRWADPAFDDLIARDDDPEEHQTEVGDGLKLVEVKDRAQRRADRRRIVTATQYGVRFHRPDGTRVCYLLADDTAGTVELMDELAAEGITRMEPVRRPVPDWEIDPDGLPAAVRHLAEAQVDGQIDDAARRAQLAGWFPDYFFPLPPGAWGRLTEAIREQLAADDEGRAADVKAAEERIAAAVAEICGGAA
jgi:hypothetical protein